MDDDPNAVVQTSVGGLEFVHSTMKKRPALFQEVILARISCIAFSGHPYHKDMTDRHEHGMMFEFVW